MAGFSSTDMQELKDIVRIGQVSKVNAGEMTARVQIPDQGIVTGDLRIVKRPPTVECETGCKIKVKPWIPTVGQWGIVHIQSRTERGTFLYRRYLMAEIGTLGDIVFKVSANKVRTFDDLKIDSKTNYAKHTRHLKKPLLEFQYNDADTASLTIYLSAFLGVNPKKMQNKIDKYRKKGKILTLVIGGKKYGSQWVITGHTKDYEKFDNQGNLLIAKSTLSLEQYAKR